MNKGKSTIELYVEGYNVDLTDGESLKNGITYGLASTKNISQKSSNQSKSITIPGTKNNCQLFDFLFDVTSTGNSSYQLPTGSARISNSIPSLTVTTMSVDPLPGIIDSSAFTPDPSLGFTFTFPVHSGSSVTSFHNQISNTGFSFITSGSGTGWVICKLNGTIISSNQVIAGNSTYYFPVDNYLFDDYLEIDFQPSFQQYAGNIGYSFNPMKKAKAYVIEDGQIIMSGYCQLMQAATKNGLVTFTLSIMSEVGGIISALGNSRLEDLFTTQTTNLTLDPSGETSETIDLPSRYDFQMNYFNIEQSWRGLTPYVIPLLDYGGNGDDKGSGRSDLTANHTNFYTSTLRPCLYIMDYWNLIFQSVGYTYESNVLNSDYFQSLIMPYCDGNFTIIDQYPVQATSTGSIALGVAYYPTPLSTYVFNEIISDTFNVYNTGSYKYTAPYEGVYSIASNLTYNFYFNPTDLTDELYSPAMTVTLTYQIYNSGGTYYNSGSYDVNQYPNGGITTDGLRYFTGIATTDNVSLSIPGTYIYLNQGDYVKVLVTATTFNESPNVFEKVSGGYASGYIIMNILNADGIEPFLSISIAPLMDGQYVRYKDFVPKSIQCSKFISSIIQLFNLYPVQDPDFPRHFQIFTRDEFFANQQAIDWTGKLDTSADITIKPVPLLDAKQLLFSYKKANDFWNKEYDSLYGNWSYGSLRVDTGYQFSNSVKDILKETIFSPTPSIQYNEVQTLGESTVEILNTAGVSGSSSNQVSVSGYNSSTGNFSGTPLTFAKKGVVFQYWGVQYLIDELINQYTFTVTDMNGEATTLYRPAGQINNTYYAQFDPFTYFTNSNLIIPAIYESSDNNSTHKSAKTNPRILYFEPIGTDSPTCNTFWIQYTPYQYLGGNYYLSGDSTTKGDAVSWNQYPYCGHLDDPNTPTQDLLFAPPVPLFFNMSGSYPSKNLYSRYWVNTVQEIADPNSRFMECSLKLSGVDISNLDLSVPVAIGGTNFRVQQITDYTGDSSKLTKCELLRIPRQINTIDGIIVNAGNDQSFALPTSASHFIGSAIADGPQGGIVVETIWSQLSGPNTASILNTANLSSSFTGLVAGSYSFQLFGADNFGYTATDTMNVTVIARTPCTPSVSATNNGPIAEPTVTTVTLSGSSAGCNGSTITSSLWTFVSGPSTPTITSATSNNTTATGLSSTGSYIFNFAITDNYGESNNASTTVIVTSAPLVTITNNTGDGTITGTLNIAGYTGGSVGPGHTISGSHTGFTAGVTVEFSAPETNASSLSLFKNGGVLQSIAIGAGVGTNQTFTSQTFSSTDILKITWN